MNIQDYQKYCTGCGLCGSEINVPMKETEAGFKAAEIGRQHVSFCSRYCPASGNASPYIRQGIWGPVLEVTGAYAADSTVRYRSSSGGVLTAAACYLLTSGRVDGVIQTRPSDQNVFSAQTVCSESVDEILACCGSRYCVTSPLADLGKLIQKGKKYAVIGRPCDILALRTYINDTGSYQKEILYLLSFFCAGTPSGNANRRMLKAMGLRTSDCAMIRYRGYGWPGMTTAEAKDGTRYQMEYKTSWSKFLGRELMPICRFCLDGTGAAADISCGDYWELRDGKPDFGEHDGRNMVLIRTEKGRQLFDELAQNHILEVMDFAEGQDGIRFIQPAQYKRITTTLPRVLAMGLLQRHPPAYDKKLLRTLAREITLREHMGAFWGTVKRVIGKRMEGKSDLR